MQTTPTPPARAPPSSPLDEAASGSFAARIADAARRGRTFCTHAIFHCVALGLVHAIFHCVCLGLVQLVLLLLPPFISSSSSLCIGLVQLVLLLLPPFPSSSSSSLCMCPCMSFARTQCSMCLLRERDLPQLHARVRIWPLTHAIHHGHTRCEPGSCMHRSCTRCRQIAAMPRGRDPPHWMARTPHLFCHAIFKI